jgi:hypothetical protein
MITHSPMTIPGSTGILERAGFNPEKAITTTTLGTRLRANGIQTHAFQHFTIARSGMSRMFLKDVDVHSFGSTAELWVSLRHLLESHAHERLFVGVYWGQLDRLSHLYGPDGEHPAAAFAQFSHAFEQYFLHRLSPALRKDTLLLLLADHGQITTPKDPFYDLKNHPDLSRRLHMKPTGENRAMYFYIRPGQVKGVREYIERTFNHRFLQVEPENVLRKGLFGPGKPHPNLAERLGDLLALARGHSYLWWAKKENPIVGRHGGMSAEEMLVPFLAVRLG